VSATTTSSQKYAIDPTHSAVRFSVRHMMITRVHGRFAGVAGYAEVPEGSHVPTAIDVTIDAASVDTRDDQRDGHLKSPDFLDVATFPTITFRSTRTEGDGEEFRIYGDLTIHGVTREVVLDTTFDGRGGDTYGNQRVGYEARTKISRKDFGLTWHQALETGGAVVGDEVKIELNVEGVLAPA